MKKFLILPLLLAVMACGSNPPMDKSAAMTPAKVVYRAQGYYNAGVAAETAYAKLPRCGQPTSPVVCSDIAIVKKVRAVDDAAWIAIQEAQKAVRTPGYGEAKLTTVVQTALSLTDAFKSITSTLPKK